MKRRRISFAHRAPSGQEPAKQRPLPQTIQESYIVYMVVAPDGRLAFYQVPASAVRNPWRADPGTPEQIAHWAEPDARTCDRCQHTQPPTPQHGTMRYGAHTIAITTRRDPVMCAACWDAWFARPDDGSHGSFTWSELQQWTAAS